METAKAVHSSPMVYWAHMLTLRCNAKCPYCIVQERGKQASQKELSGKEILDWWNNIAHPSRQRLSLIGGEPTLHRDLIEILNNLDGYFITLTTNCIGSFFKNRKYKEIKVQATSGLRINTSFHPSDISPKEYVSHVMEMREAGFWVHQMAFVDVPNNKYEAEIREVNKTLPLLPQPFLGFWSEKDGFNAPRKLEFLYPSERYLDQERALAQCGKVFSDGYDFYREACGQEKSKTVRCPNKLLALLISPAGFCYNCHHRLYHNINPICNIKDFKPMVSLKDIECSHFGFCNSCDINRIYHGSRLNTVYQGDLKVTWLKEIRGEDDN